MKLSRVHHALAVAALLAMTLLACMPTVGRLAQASGMAPVAVAQAPSHGGHGDGMPAAPTGRDACGYCALLGAVAMPALPRIAIERAQAAPLPVVATTPAFVGHGGWTLGSRGPPRAHAS